MLNEADLQYNRMVGKILSEGYDDKDEIVRGKYADGTPAHTLSITSQKFTFSGNQVPILTTKFVAWKTAIKELLWIWQMKSNVVQDLRDMGVKIWDEWEQEDGTIGKSYGYQLAKKNRTIKDGVIKPYKADQVDYLLNQLTFNPSSRRHITTLWNPDELDEMALTPCVYETQWHVKGKELRLDVGCRSNDMALGNPFNIFQYHVLHRMIAQVTGYEVGEYNFSIGDCHVYDRHVEAIKEQIQRPLFTPPVLKINPDIKNFYDFTIDDFELVGYQYGDKLNYEVAI